MKYNNFDEILDGPCNNQYTLLAIISRHHISKEEYDAKVKARFGDHPEPPINIDGSFLELTQPTEGNCKSHCFEFLTEDGSNRRIRYRPVEIGPKRKASILDKKEIISEEIIYSYQLFKGISFWLKAVKFDFTLAQEGNVLMIIFRALDSNNEAIYHGNITHLFPIL